MLSLFGFWLQRPQSRSPSLIPNHTSLSFLLSLSSTSLTLVWIMLLCSGLSVIYGRGLVELPGCRSTSAVLLVLPFSSLFRSPYCRSPDYFPSATASALVLFWSGRTDCQCPWIWLSWSSCFNSWLYCLHFISMRLSVLTAVAARIDVTVSTIPEVWGVISRQDGIIFLSHCPCAFQTLFRRT